MAESFGEILQAAQAGEEWAVGCLWREMQPRLLRFLRARDARAAEDVASETWLRVARNLRTFEGGEVEFRGWLFTIARRALIDWQRKARRGPATTELDEWNEPPSGDDPAGEAIETLGTARALQLLRRLPDDQAEVILLRVVGGLDATGVGEILGKRPGTVRVLQHRGLRRLAELLSTDAVAEEGVTQ
jgi:RNA polymerase sigma-70 factor, ECF subfamily